MFRIVGVKATKHKFVYSVETVQNGEEILGKFDGDMLKHAVDEDQHRLHVVDERMYRGQRQFLVHWDGYANNLDEWMPAERVFNI